MLTAVCAIIYNEHENLKEWVDYHLNIGFDYIYLFEDYGSDSHRNIVQDNDRVILSNLKDFCIANTNSSKKQRMLYTKFLTVHKKLADIDWIAFIDIDEFIVFDEGYNLSKLLDEFKMYPSIILCWKNYNASGHLKKKPADVSTMDYYTAEANIWVLHDEIIWMVKSIHNVQRSGGVWTVHMGTDGVYTDLCTEKNRKTACYKKAWINHYFYKSWEDWCYRMIGRGNMHNNFRTFDTWFAGNPEFADKEVSMLNSIRKEHMRSTYVISRKWGLISGGNKTIIDKLKRKRDRPGSSNNKL